MICLQPSPPAQAPKRLRTVTGLLNSWQSSPCRHTTPCTCLQGASAKGPSSNTLHHERKTGELGHDLSRPAPAETVEESAQQAILFNSAFTSPGGPPALSSGDAGSKQGVSSAQAGPLQSVRTGRRMSPTGETNAGRCNGLCEPQSQATQPRHNAQSQPVLSSVGLLVQAPGLRLSSSAADRTFTEGMRWHRAVPEGWETYTIDLQTA